MIQTRVGKQNVLNPYSNVVEIVVHENLTGRLVGTDNDKQ